MTLVILAFKIILINAQTFDSLNVDGMIYCRLNAEFANAMFEYDTISDVGYNSSILGFDSIANIAQVHTIEYTFKGFGRTNENLKNIFTIKFQNFSFVEDFISFLENDNKIDYAEKVPFYYCNVSPNDPDYNSTLQWNLFKIQAENAWDITKGKTDIKVAVVDDAVRLDHEDLQRKIWVNQGEIPSTLNVPDPDGNQIIDISELMIFFGVININSLFAEVTLFNGIDDDNNSYCDDVLGWDATDGTDNNPNPPANANNTLFAHGTHVAGIAAAETTPNGSTGQGIASIGWNLSIIPVKCKNDTSTNPETLHNAVSGTEYAIDAGADIINMSWGSFEYNSTLENLMIEAHNKGIILVSAAGNNGMSPTQADVVLYPAGYDHVISVGSSDNQDIRSSFSSYSNNTEKWVDVMAPGTAIYSSVPTTPNSYYIHDGTSMASPLVAGVTGLMKSFCPGCSPDQIRDCLYSTCDSMPNENLYHEDFDTSKVGYGRVNALEALNCISTIEPVAAFDIETDFFCEGVYDVELYDLSTGFITSWEWISPSSCVSFSSTSSANTTFSLDASACSSFTISLIVHNDSIGLSDTITHSFNISVPSVNILYTDSIVEHCNDNDNYFIVEFENANPPFEVSYSDNLGNTYVESNITSNPAVINVSPGNNVTTVYTLTGFQSYNGCSGNAAASISFVSSQCDCFSVYLNNHWTFGLSKAIQFEPTYNDPTNGLYMIPFIPGYYYTEEACASISDSYGNLMFYSDGENIYDKSYDKMLNGDNIVGHTSSAQGAIILPKSSADQTYYVITVSALHSFSNGQTPVHSIGYNIVDMSDQGNSSSSLDPYGKVIIRDQPLETNGINVTEKLTWVKHDTIPDNYWVITHSRFGNYFLVYLASPDTIVLDHIDTVGISLINPCAGCLKANLVGTRLVAVYASPNTLEFYEFNNVNGEISLLNSIPTTYPAYGLEFSPNSAYVYFSGGTGIINRYSIIGNSLQNLSLIQTGNSNIKGLQLAPDHQSILFAQSNSNYIGALNSPNSANPGLNSQQYTLQSTYIGLNFPQLVPSNSIDLNIMSITDDCDNSCSGSAMVQGFSTCPPIAYQWDDPQFQTGQTATGLCAGEYFVTSTDGCGCTGVVKVVVGENTLEIEDVIETDDCLGGYIGAIDLVIDSPFPPLTYQWSNNSITEGISGLASGTYEVVVSDSHGCTASASVSVGIDNIIISGIPNNPNCTGSGDGIIDISMSNGIAPYSYFWNNGTNNEDAIGLSPGQYHVNVVDSRGCFATDTFIIVDPLPISIIATIQDASCNGFADGSINQTISGGTPPYQFIWSTNDTTEDVSGLASSTYYVTITDSNGCQEDTSYFVDHPTLPRYTLDNADTVCNCSGWAVAADTLYNSFVWSTGDTAYTIYGLCPGIYEITVTEFATGCQVVEAFTINYMPMQIQGVSTINANCPLSDGSAWIETDTILYGSSGYTFQWYQLIGGIGVLSTSDSISGLTPSPYEVIVTDTNGCVDTAQFIIGHYDPDSINVFTINNTCPQTSDGSAYFVDSLLGINTQAWLYSWSINGTLGMDSIYNLATGTYWLQVVDSNQCQAITFFEIENEYVLEIDTIHALAEFCDDACNGEIQIDMLNGTPGFEYILVMDTAQSGSSLYSFDNLCPGSYNVIVTDSMGCTTNAGPIEIEEFDYDISWTITADDCINPADYLIQIYASGYFLPPLTYALDGTTLSDSIHVPTNGTYFLAITDGNNCTVFDTIIIEQTNINFQITTINSTCESPYNGSAIVDSLVGISPFSFFWSNGANTNPNENLSPGQYFVTVTDAYGCQYIDFAFVGDKIAQLFWEVIPPVCMDSVSGAIDVEIDQGDIYYTYEWSENGVPGFSNEEDIDSLVAGYVYSLTATGTVDGCVLTLTDTIPQEADLGITLLMSGGSCNNLKDSLGYKDDGKIEVDVSGGSGNFIFSWEMNGSPISDTTYYIDSLESGTIMTVTVTDQNSSCSGSATDTIRWKQKINLIPGWGLMSTYISPTGNQPVNIYFENQNIDNDISIMKNNAGQVYWPGYFNMIGTFSAVEGYQIKMFSNQVFELCGQLNCPEDYPIVNNSGWHIWPYLRLNPMDAKFALDSIVAAPYTPQIVELMKSGSGQIYWPIYDINNIGDLIPGEGYQIKLNNSVTFYYPNNDTIILTKNSQEMHDDVYAHYLNLYINTDNFMILGIPTDAWEEVPNIGDEVAAIGEYGQIAGRAIYKGGFTAIVIYGDDYYTPNIIEGLSTDEQFTLEIWNSETKSLKLFKIKLWSKGDGYFSNEKISVAGVSEVETGVQDAPFIVHVYPNPSKGNYNLEVISTIKTEVELTIYNQNGQLIYNKLVLEISEGVNSYNVEILDNISGTFFLNLLGKNCYSQIKLMLIK